jgi:Tfp pilus assembly protein PilF
VTGRGAALAVLLAIVGAASAAAQPPAPTPAPAAAPTPRPPLPHFPQLVSSYLGAASAESRKVALERLVQRRAELNILNHEAAALALVRHGLSQLAAGDSDAALQTLRGAAELAPDLPDVHFALARAGAGGVVAGYLADADTRAGASRLLTFAIACLVCGVLGAVTALGLVTLLRHGRLLVHDLRENASSASLAALAPGTATVVLLLPLVLFQGWGWLPLWWLSVLFAYMSGSERAGAVTALVLTTLLAPALTLLEQRQVLDANPLLWSGVRTLESAADPRDLETLLAAQRANPDDRDLAYLVALQLEKAGQAESAAEVYRSVLGTSPDDAVSQNNLAKVELARGEAQGASRRLRSVADSSAASRIRGTALYNLSIVNLQLFDFDAAAQLRQQADELARRETTRYEALWSYETPEGSAVSAPVSLGPQRSELEAKLAGAAEGSVARANLTGSGARVSAAPGAAAFASRLVAFVAVFVLGWLGLRLWRGGLLLTRRCLKCGEPFSRRTRAGADAAALCNPCYHLYVVKDGISAPARRAKLAEVESWDRRTRIGMRLLALLSPGAAQAYAGRALAGLAVGLAWYAAVAALLLLRTGALPVSDAPGSLGGSAAWILAAALAGLVWLIANLAVPSLDQPLPSARRARRTAA